VLKEAIAYGRKIRPYVRDYFPDFLDELRGYSEASNVPLVELIAQWSGYTPSLAVGRKGCTDLAVSSEVTKDGCVYAAHNEDYSSVYEGLVVPVHIQVTGKPDFFAMSYGGIFPTIGFNSAGISLTGNEVSPNDRRLGIPKMFPPRKVLEATSFLEALSYSTPEKRGDSFNNIVCTAEGELYSMEASATQFEAIYGADGFIVHTNHYTSPKMLKFEENFGLSTRVRYNRALKLLKSELGKVTVDTIMKIQSDHIGYPLSICRHEDPKVTPKLNSKTLFGAIINLTDKTVLITQGNPCTPSYSKYKLGD
jgi:isopenicillin-N N-acyltransferase-like protein